MQYSSQEDRELYFNKIVEDIELIQYYQINDEDLWRLFDSKIIFEEIYPLLEVDNFIRKVVDRNLRGYKIINEEKIQKRNDELEKLKNSFIESIINI